MRKIKNNLNCWMGHQRLNRRGRCLLSSKENNHSSLVGWRCYPRIFQTDCDPLRIDYRLSDKFWSNHQSISFIKLTDIMTAKTFPLGKKKWPRKKVKTPYKRMRKGIEMIPSFCSLFFLFTIPYKTYLFTGGFR